ncbi:protein KASH5 isoform X1 [Melospiza melodia melodia]|uniref:protein KASH5 isoform X1 n=1 Tax=Melospiza melodia melodia TaxID=1914991 RepID=UPI002FCE855C
MKAVVKRLEEENTELRRQARHAEKEQRSLCSRAEGLQEENQRLLAEGQGLREQLQAQAARVASLEVSTVAMELGLCWTVTVLSPCPHPSAQAQLCRGTALLSARDTALAQVSARSVTLPLPQLSPGPPLALSPSPSLPGPVPQAGRGRRS